MVHDASFTKMWKTCYKFSLTKWFVGGRQWNGVIEVANSRLSTGFASEIRRLHLLLEDALIWVFSDCLGFAAYQLWVQIDCVQLLYLIKVYILFCRMSDFSFGMKTCLINLGAIPCWTPQGMGVASSSWCQKLPRSCNSILSPPNSPRKTVKKHPVFFRKRHSTPRGAFCIIMNCMGIHHHGECHTCSQALLSLEGLEYLENRWGLSWLGKGWDSGINSSTQGGWVFPRFKDSENSRLDGWDECSCYRMSENLQHKELDDPGLARVDDFVVGLFFFF